MKLDLYYAPGSCAFASLIALCEAGAEFEANRVALSDGEQHSEWFRAINQRGRVPVLIIDGEPISETLAILSFVASRFPDAELLPLEDPLGLARAYELMAWLASSVHITIAQLWRSERFADDTETINALKAAAPQRLEAAFNEIETRIAAPWVFGNRYSLVDGYLGVFHRWARRLNVDMSHFPRWQAQYASLEQRPAVQRAITIENSKAPTTK